MHDGEGFTFWALKKADALRAGASERKFYPSFEARPVRLPARRGIGRVSSRRREDSISKGWMCFLRAVLTIVIKTNTQAKNATSLRRYDAYLLTTPMTQTHYYW